METSPSVQYPLGTYIETECPEVEMLSRVRVRVEEQLIKQGEREFFSRHLIAADSNFFSVFPYRFVYGDSATALNKPQTVVISRDLSEQLFGQKNPLGEVLELDNKNLYSITGVIEKPGPSHLNFDLCISDHSRHFTSNWFMKSHDTYVMLKPGSSVQRLESQVNEEYGKHLEETGSVAGTRVFLEPVRGIHISPRAQNTGQTPETVPVYDFNRGNLIPVLIFSSIAILVLLLAGINYTNMAIARVGTRGKEAALRKVMGSSVRQLIFQFLTEAFIQVLIALILALALTVFLTDILNGLFHLELSLWSDLDPARNQKFIIQILAVLFGLSLLSGVYPAFLWANQRPSKTLKGGASKHVAGQWMRGGLVGFQYCVATCFIICIVIIGLQLRYMEHSDPGFNTSQLLRIQTRDVKLFPGQPGDRSAYVESTLKSISGVTAVTMSSSYPGRPHVNMQQAVSGNDSLSVSFNFIGPGYFKTMGMHMASGRNFFAGVSSDTINSAIVNQAFIKKMGWNRPLNKIVDVAGRRYTIIGIVEDAFMSGYAAQIPPEIYVAGVDARNFAGHSNIILRIDGKRTRDIVKRLGTLWKGIEPDYPVRYAWVDEDFARLSEKYERFGILTGFLSATAIIIAVGGMFALSAFLVTQRTKEIGVRKVLGASVRGIIRLVVSKFVRLVLIAIIIASPLAWWLMSNWLEEFAHRIEIKWWMFVSAWGIAVVIAALTVSVQAVKAAVANPVKSLSIDR